MATEGDAPQPKAILRGHKAQVHAACFIRENARLVTGDAEGFVVVWDLTIMRPRAVWQAHANAILGISGWQDDKIITHGRDNKLIVWKLAPEDESAMSTSLPLTPVLETRSQPWLLHLLEVNTMNFCAFAACEPPADASGVLRPELSVAVPNTLASEAIDIFHLPSQRRTHTIKLGDKNGMVMALTIFYHEDILLIVAGYENGLAIVASLDRNGNVSTLYQAKPHSQPILSLDTSPDKSYFITSSADALLVKHPIPLPTHETEPSPPELVVPQAPSTTRSGDDNTSPDGPEGKPVSLLSAAISKAPPVGRPAAESVTVRLHTEPLKIINTKHAGQQSLRVRSDGKVFATAGWDSRVRVYSSKTMKEVAVLKWHQVGCYAAAFSALQDPSQETESTSRGETRPESLREVVPRLVDVTVKERRIKNAESAHWLAAGSKDGKVSLWDVF